jgi:hypothetical protein
MQLRPEMQCEQQQQHQWQQQHMERTAQADWQQLQQQLQQQEGDGDPRQDTAGWATHNSLSQLSPRLAAAAAAPGRNACSSAPQQLHQQQQQHVTQEPSFASGLGLAAADVAAACTSSPRRHLGMQPTHAAADPSYNSRCSSYTAQELQSSAAGSYPRLQPVQLAGLLPAQLSIGLPDLNCNRGVSQEDEEAAAYEARLVAKVLEMERSMQALESQLLHVGCSDTE